MFPEYAKPVLTIYWKDAESYFDGLHSHYFAKIKRVALGAGLAAALTERAGHSSLGLISYVKYRHAAICRRAAFTPMDLKRPLIWKRVTANTSELSACMEQSAVGERSRNFGYTDVTEAEIYASNT